MCADINPSSLERARGYGADAIVNTKRDWHDRPREEQKMKSVTVDTQGVEYEAPETL